jgi:hypothetical protein
MRGLASASRFLPIFFLAGQIERIQAQELELAIQRNADQTFTLSVLNAHLLREHTFIEFSTNGVWFPAYFASSNSIQRMVYNMAEPRAVRIFRAVHSQTMASQVKASWERLGATNYVFHYSQLCLCGPNFPVSATVTVASNEVVKVENAKNREGNPIAELSLSILPTINKIFDAWIAAEPNGGYAPQLEFDKNGFPKAINIDIAPQNADDELIYTIDSFAPLP